MGWGRVLAKGISFRERNIHFAKDFFLQMEDIISNLNG